MKRNCLFTVNIGNFVNEYVRRRFLAAAHRWNCDYVEVHDSLVPLYPTCSKLLGADRLIGYDKIVYYDGDVVISDHAPSPFDLCVEDDTLYAVSDYQPSARCDQWRTVVFHGGTQPVLRAKPEWKEPTQEEFFNAGFWMFRQGEKIRKMFASIQDNLPPEPTPFCEQGTTNVVAYNTEGIKVSLLPETWNHIIPGYCEPVPEFYANHFGGWAHSLLNENARRDGFENPDSILDAIAIRHGTDKSSTSKQSHAYTKHYEKIFGYLRHAPIKLLEIGVLSGSSIRTWLEYFDHAKIYGVDINNDPVVVDPRYTFSCGDQSNFKFWKAFIEKHGEAWDIIIDDGSHVNKAIIAAFSALWPKVRSGGHYVIEDLCCAYRPEYQIKGVPTQMEFLQTMLKFINNGESDVESIRFSRELAILTKR